MKRRNALIGMGGLVAGAGALVGTGAFDTVEAQRDVTVETAGDADAFLGLEPARSALGLGGEDFVDAPEDGVIEIQIDDPDTDEGGAGLNRRAITTFDHLVLITNQGTQDVDEITLEFTESPVDADTTFSFPVADTDGTDITSDGEVVEHDGAVNILTGDAAPGSLTPGEGVVFGLRIDLVDGGNDENDLPDDGEYALTITAEAADD